MMVAGFILLRNKVSISGQTEEGGAGRGGGEITRGEQPGGLLPPWEMDQFSVRTCSS